MKTRIFTTLLATLFLGSVLAQAPMFWGFEEGQEFPFWNGGPDGKPYDVEIVTNDAENAFEGSGYLFVETEAKGADAWSHQVAFGGFEIDDPQGVYRVSLWAKGEFPAAAEGIERTINVTAGSFHYQDLAVATQKYESALTDEYRKIVVMIMMDQAAYDGLPAGENNDNQHTIRVPVHFGNAIGKFYIDNFEFVKSPIGGGIVPAAGDRVILMAGYDMEEISVDLSVFTLVVDGEPVTITDGMVDPENESYIHLLIDGQIKAGDEVVLSKSGVSGFAYAADGPGTAETDYDLADFSNEVITNLSAVVSNFIPGNVVDSSVKVYVEGDNFVVASTSPVASVEVINLTGQTVASQAGSVVAAGHLRGGLYILKVEMVDGTVSTQKVIK